MWVIFDIMEWIKLVSLERREEAHRQDPEEKKRSAQKRRVIRTVSHQPKETHEGEINSTK